ncbi:MAG: metal-dependent hydrolase [Nitrospinota bacterium]
MNLLFHACMGVSLAHALGAGAPGTMDVVLMGTASVSPDLDALSALGGRERYRRWHRSLGHSLPAVAALPSAVALGLGARAGALWALAMGAHVAVDLLSAPGVALAFPASARRWQLPLLSWGDCYLSGGYLAAAWLGVLYPEAAQPLGATAILALPLYLLYRRRHPLEGDPLRGWWFGLVWGGRR